MLVLALVLLAPPLSAQEISGTWNGILDANGTRLRLVFHITKSDSGYAATLDSPDQNVKGIPVAAASFREPELRLELRRLNAVYAGTRAGDSITGTWTQGTTTLPLVLSKGAASATPRARPQEPTRPYPYHEEEVAIPNAADGVTLAGTLTLPRGAGPHPAVVLISGSGPQNRDEEVFGHKPFLVLADQLTREGFAVLRYDDRGVGASTGTFTSATSQDFARDAASVVAYLTSRREIDRAHIGVIGHSEGAHVASMVAAGSPNVTFVVLLAGIGIPGRDVSLMQAKTLRPFSVPDEAAYTRLVERSIGIASSSADVLTKRRELKRHYEANRALIESMLPAQVGFDTFLAARVAELTSPWQQFFLAYDPATDLAKVTVPVLSLNGRNDVQVPAEVNQARIRESLEKGGNRHHLVKVLPGLNHMFQQSETGAMREYPLLEETFSPMALNEIVSWIRTQVR
jgi:pimeloyl-ACP methyl ester carboxylesterase